MKNLILVFALLITTAFVSCTNRSASNETPEVDSTEVDTVETVDSLVVEADTLAVDSVM